MELPLLAYNLMSKSLDKLFVTRSKVHLADRFSSTSVFEITRARTQFAAFVYMCKLNLDKDGAPNTYGYDNPAKGSAQNNLKPLEYWEKARTHLQAERSGLGNACGDPGDGTKGWRNFLDGTRNFYWAGLQAVTKKQGREQGLVVDDRTELEAGLATHSPRPVVLPKGTGYFPVVQASGYYISGSALAADASTSAYNPDHYLDASIVPYAVWANNWAHVSIGGKKLQLGDFGLAIENSTGANMGFVYGDAGTSNKVGECSQILHSSLGEGAGLVTFIAFPGSGKGPKEGIGRNAESFIPGKVYFQMRKLGVSAPELAARLAMGRELRVPPKPIDLIPGSSGLYRNFTSAMKQWVTTP